ncbi:hypothetical protein ACFYWP_37210 [Actinacidiphila glaucinigra]|uniref:hypothetical protein n=1 Tax=Actinacidiphila glaucinigra TaxID=235986 RepID=UPI00368F007D
MKVPTKLAGLAARLQGKTTVYDTDTEVVGLLNAQTDRIYDERTPTHAADAARLTDELDYQPGLVDLHGDVCDVAVLLDALTTTATDLGNSDLTDSLAEAAEAAHELRLRLATAVRATVPGPQIPLTEAA